MKRFFDLFKRHPEKTTDIAPAMQKLLRSVAMTEEREIPCDEVFALLDQFAESCAVAGSALFLDCRSSEWRPVPLPADVDLVVLHTGSTRSLTRSEYNVRRSQCEAGVAFLRQQDPAVRSLRDVPVDFLRGCAEKMDPLLYRRCAYVILENARVLSAWDALMNGDLKSSGDLMFQSHAGLRDEFQVSTPELDLLVEAAARVPGSLGARMMGAGFGGCTLHAVEVGQREEVVEAVQAKFRRVTGREAMTYEVQIEEGTHSCDPL